ncbi:hypothetical protein B0H17DRAFT_1325068 [Mycena rosella]|uniref:Uncharacterized protein n=1 Tax=Mycena rosella TaxID=1033263 RepID=A0AAD7GYE1_MYCRO|nr:hypothetical protein B0H17DRAFT_1325068 [Mycena rosella]
MDSAASLNLNTTIGALQIGVLISYVLLGVTTTQTYIYYCRFPDDSPKLKALVAAVWVCEMAHAFCFVIMKKNLIWLAMFSINARLFSNSLLASLNSRAALRAMSEASVSLSLPSRIGLSFRSVQNNTKGRQVAHTAKAPRGQSDKPTSEDISETS